MWNHELARLYRDEKQDFSRRQRGGTRHSPWAVEGHYAQARSWGHNASPQKCRRNEHHTSQLCQCLAWPTSEKSCLPSLWESQAPFLKKFRILCPYTQWHTFTPNNANVLVTPTSLSQSQWLSLHGLQQVWIWEFPYFHAGNYGGGC